ncbi:MAG: zinc ribbon domain-containing protein [Lachnospiraceae bacterium]|nr:zinc ribbon domain-containing protein [Lachnospiraceae bacterium]
MYCRYCGAQIPDDVKFCTNCGKSVLGAEPDLGRQQNEGAGYENDGTYRRSLLVKPNLIGIIASVLIGISVFMPFASASIFGTTISTALIDGVDGVIILIIAAAALLFSIFGLNIPVIVMGAISVVCFFIDSSALDKDADHLLQSMIQKGSGYYLMIIAAFALTIAGIIGLLSKKKNK